MSLVIEATNKGKNIDMIVGFGKGDIIAKYGKETSGKGYGLIFSEGKPGEIGRKATEDDCYDGNTNRAILHFENTESIDTTIKNLESLKERMVKDNG